MAVIQLLKEGNDQSDKYLYGIITIITIKITLAYIELLFFFRRRLSQIYIVEK
jgi:hypothetical protein